MAVAPSLGKPDSLPLDVLHLDPQNARLPETIQVNDEKELIGFIASTYNAIEIARSIALHGYFPSEPLIVVAQDDAYLVIEGNRRLVALRILADPALARGLDDASEWSTVAENAQLPELIPVVIASDRQAVAPIIGYRHISGIEPWEPYAKARFIAALVDEGSLQFEGVAVLVGERTTDIAAQYRNLWTAKQAKEDFGIDATRVTRRFGVFTRAMTSIDLRSHIGAPAPSHVSPGQKPLAGDSAENVRELFSWIFGDEEDERVIEESRDITDLGTVVASEDGLRVLRQTRDLRAAFATAGGLRDRLITRLKNANNNLVAAREDLGAYFNEDEVQELLDQCHEALRLLVEPDANNI